MILLIERESRVILNIFVELCGIGKEMARIRYLKPEFFKDEDLADLKYQTRITFQGLWCYADREGRLEDRPKYLKAEIFPYDNVDMDKELDILSKPKARTGKPFIIRYNINNNKYIQILEFLKHQKPHHTEKDSEILEPTLKDKGNGDGEDKGNGKAQQSECEVKERVNNGEVTVKFDFESIWKRYPRKKGKEKAIRSFNKQIKTADKWTLINKCLDNYLKEIEILEREEQYILHGSTWFNESWKDYVEWTPPKPKSTSPKKKFEYQRGDVDYDHLGKEM